VSSPLRIIFAGTPEFSVPALQALLNSPHKIISVYTQPDRPSGRGQKLTASPVKQVAIHHGIPVHQPISLRESSTQQVLKNLAPDVMIVVAYGLILPKIILDIPRLGCINIHASLLPKWRGAAPIQRAILSGNKQTGITIMQMNEGLDTGDMLAKKSCDIFPDDTTQTLHDRLSQMGGELIAKVLNDLQQGKIIAEKQNDDDASYAKKIEKHEAEINWNKSAIEIERLIRAFNPWPVAHTQLGENTLRVWHAKVLDEKTTQMPGTIVHTAKEGIDVATGDGILRLQQIQLPGAKALPVGDILNSKGDLFRVGMLLKNKT
jgi:methionyl-tRNA formyltransferase